MDQPNNYTPKAYAAAKMALLLLLLGFVLSMTRLTEAKEAETTLHAHQTAAQADDVFIVVNSDTTTVNQGETFTVTIQVQAGTQEVEGVSAYLDFDPAVLQVQSIRSAALPTWESVYSDTFDNSNGQIDYAVGISRSQFWPYPTGTFDLLEIEFEAIAGSTGTTLAFHTSPPRQTDVTSSGGGSVLTGSQDNTVVIPSVILALSPPTVTIGLGETFELPIEVHAGTQEVDGVAAYLNFDPAYLEVVSITPGGDFSIVLVNQFDNDNGQLGFAAGSFSNFPSGSFTLATVTVRTTALTDEDGTLVEFNTTLPRLSDATFDSTSVLADAIESPIFAEKMVMMALSPPTLTTHIGETFELPILVQADTQLVYGAEAHLNFNPTHMQVANITAGDELNSVLNSSFDNSSGQLHFAAGTFNLPYPSGTFTLATVTFTATNAITDTLVYFETTQPRQSDATFAGTSVLSDTSGSTITILNAILNASVTLQGRPSPPHSRWIVPLRVSLTIPGESVPAYEFEPTTDENGHFTITDIIPGTYEVRVKNSHTLQNKQTVTLMPYNNGIIDLGTLPEGDANDDNYVTLLDFSILAGAFGKCEADTDYDERADFNQDGCVTILDFSLLASNFGQGGDTLRAPLTAPSTQEVAMHVAPSSSKVVAGEQFNVTVQLETGEQSVDGAQVVLNFDPAVLEVVAMTASDKLPLELQKQFDNANGTIAFAAGSLEAFPAGTIPVVEVEFRALAETEGTSLAFGSPDSLVTFSGAALPTELTDSTITISANPTSVTLNRLSTMSPSALSLLALAPLAMTILAGAWIMRRRRRG